MFIVDDKGIEEAIAQLKKDGVFDRFNKMLSSQQQVDSVKSSGQVGEPTEEEFFGHHDCFES
jgi:hypothetical protein